VPVAEPSGEYEIACSVDLSPVFGKIENKTTVTITQPPADILDRRLKELESDDVDTGVKAARDLSYFEKDGARVFPALLAHLDDPDESIRMSVFSAMTRYTDQIKDHVDIFLEILGNKEESDYFRQMSASCVSYYAALSADVEEALKQALESYKGHDYESAFKYYLERYQERMKKEG